MRTIAFVLLLLTAAAAAQPLAPESLPQGFVLVVEDRSGLSSEASPLYLASNHGGWNPGNPAMKLSRRSDSRWQIDVPRPADGSSMQFKFTRGSWDLVEVAADLSDIPNRTLAPVEAALLTHGQKPVIELVVEKFADQRPDRDARIGVDPYRTLEVTGTVRRLQVVGGPVGPGATVRDLLVWLPPGYDDPANAARRYPVVYLHDGQNLFEQLPGVPGEWHADETAAAMIARGDLPPFIMVGIPHGGASRASEYLPVPAIRGVEARAAEHLGFLVREVMPRIERAFRVEPGRENTFVGGASLGAVVSLSCAAQRPDLFGGVLLESMPTLAGAGSAWRDYVAGLRDWPPRVFVGMSGREAGTDEEKNRLYQDWARQVEAAAAAAGSAHMLVITPDATHNEDAWAGRFAAALSFLFGE